MHLLRNAFLHRLIPAIAVLICWPVSTAMAEKQVSFPSARYQISAFRKRLALDRGETVPTFPAIQLLGYLSQPVGHLISPAVIILHGCEGLPSGSDLGAERYNSWGYVTLVVDSFRPRGIKEACSGSGPDRLADALGALAYLSKLPFVDPHKIAVVGFSQGGLVALRVASPQPAGVFDVPSGVRVRAAVAYYPPCAYFSGHMDVPTLILIGTSDEWAPAKDCERLAEGRAGQDALVRIVEYQGAHHAFNVSSLQDGKMLLGRLLQYDPEAAAAASAETEAFLARQLAP